MKKNSKTQTSTTKQYDHPGRPRHSLRAPKAMTFSFTKIMEANGCDIRPGKNYGKALDEKGCTMLTLRKNLRYDMYILDPKTKKIVRVNPRSQFVLVHGVTCEPESETGLGRRGLVYCLRVNKDNVKAPKTSTPKTSTTKKVSTPKVAKVKKTRTPKSQTPTADVLDKIHAALIQPEAPVPALTVPAVTIAPEAPEVAPAPAPVIEAPATSTLPVVSPETEVPAPAPEAAPVATLVNS